MKAGFGKACITPILGTPCALGLDNEAEEVYDDIYVRALCLQDEAPPVVALSVDVIGMNRPETKMVADRAARAARISPERVVVHCTHTHESPNSRIQFGEYLAQHGLRSYSPDFWEQLQAGAEAACEEALGDLTEARALYGEAAVHGIASNRRILDADGKATMRGSRATPEMRAHPEGHIDPKVRVLVFDRAHDRVFAMCYCCHPSAAGGDEGPYITGDFPGYALARLESDDLAGLHFTGPCGNINPGKYTLVSEVVAWRVGEAAICFLPGECFLEIDEGIREASTGPLLTVENCDYSPSYIPTPQAYEQGGYEANVAHVAPEAFSKAIEAGRTAMAAAG